VQRGAKAYDKATPGPEMEKAPEFEELLYIYCEKPSEMKEKQVKGGPLLCGEKAIMANLSEPQFKTFCKAHATSIVE
jgi:phosphatidylinositol phospholipase C delta